MSTTRKDSLEFYETMTETLPDASSLAGAVITENVLATQSLIQTGLDAQVAQNPLLNLLLPPDIENQKGLPDVGALPSSVFGFIAKFFAYFSPFALLYMWVDAWEKTKILYFADNKNYSKVLDLGVSLFRAAASTTLLLLVVFAAPAVLFYAGLPLVGAMIVVGLAYGLFKLGKAASAGYRAYKKAKASLSPQEKAKAEAARNQNIFMVAVNLVGTAFGVLAFIVNYNLGRAAVELYEGGQKAESGDLNGLGEIRQGAQAFLDNKREVELLELFSITSLLPVLYQKAKTAWTDTVNYYAKPGRAAERFAAKCVNGAETLAGMWKEGGLHRVAAVAGAIIEPLRMLCILPFHIIPAFVGLGKAIYNSIAGIEVVESLMDQEAIDAIHDGHHAQTNNPEKQAAEREALLHSIEENIVRIESKHPNSSDNKITAKLGLLHGMANDLELEVQPAISAAGKQNSAAQPNRVNDLPLFFQNHKDKGPVFQSFKAEKGKVEQDADTYTTYKERWMPKVTTRISCH